MLWSIELIEIGGSRRSSVVERRPHKANVAGSIPAVGTNAI